jgi:ketosteroid isomerase-like protein
MSEQNLELVRAYLDAFATGGVDAVVGFWDPEINWRAAEGALDDVGEMQGIAAMRRYVEEWVDMFDDFRMVAEEIRDVGDGRVLAVHRIAGRAKISGVETEIRFAVVYVIRGDKIVRGREYLTLAEALNAVGIGGE